MSSSKRVTPITIQKYLKGIKYPVSKQNLIEHAEKNSTRDRNYFETHDRIVIIRAYGPKLNCVHSRSAAKTDVLLTIGLITVCTGGCSWQILMGTLMKTS